MIKIKRLLAGAAAVALSVIALPAQAITSVAGGPDSATAEVCDNADWGWSITTPARYKNDDSHATVIGLSAAVRTVTITEPTSGPCGFEQGDTWRVYSSAGGWSASGTISAQNATDGRDTDVVEVDVPDSNSVAGDELSVRLKVSDADFPGWEVDNSSADGVAPFTPLRRALFKYHTIDNRINFSEPYVADEPIRSGGNLIRASWSSNSYVGYSNREVQAEARPVPGGYTGTIVDEVLTGAGGTVAFSFTVDEAGGPNPGDTFVVRAVFGGNGTTSGNHSTGDEIAPAA